MGRSGKRRQARPYIESECESGNDDSMDIDAPPKPIAPQSGSGQRGTHLYTVSWIVKPGSSPSDFSEMRRSKQIALENPGELFQVLILRLADWTCLCSMVIPGSGKPLFQTHRASCRRPGQHECDSGAPGSESVKY